jgi:DNA-binding transcriptional MerR regulator
MVPSATDATRVDEGSLQMNATAKASRPAMRIGRLAALTGRNVHTIRWYESQRLIPGVRRDPQGRRIYAASHVEWLDLLERLKRTGMSIREIREYTAMVKRGDSTLQERHRLMKAHRERVAAMMQDLQDSLELIDGKIDFYGSWLSTGVRPPLPRAPSRKR